MLSRGRPKEHGHFWNPGVLPHIESELRSFPTNLILDGEHYCHGMSLQQINSRCAVKRLTPHDDHQKITYNIFDVVRTLPFHQRLEILNNIQSHITRSGLSYIRVVETQMISNEREFDMAYKMWRLDGYEGAMFRSYDAVYGLEQNCTNQDNRWTCLLKRKDSLDLDCFLIEVVAGHEGKWEDTCGRLLLETPDGVQFYSGSGLDDSERPKLWAMKERLKDSRVLVRVTCDEMSDNGTPLRNRIEMIDLPEL